MQGGFLLNWAQAYASQGWHVFPCVPRTKKPLTAHGCLDATTDASKIAAWWTKTPDANIGIATGPKSGLHVVDPDGAEGLAEWASLGYSTPTATVATPRGGRHLYFALPPGLVLPNRKLSANVDTRGAGGYVVAPPSISLDGKEYRWELPPDETPPAPLPDFLRARGNLEGLTIAPADTRPDAYERCNLYLACLPDALAGQGGHAATLRVACECFRFGLTESQAWDLLSSYNSLRCHPAWSERELRHKLSDGRKLVDRENTFGSKLEQDNNSDAGNLRAIGIPSVFASDERGEATGNEIENLGPSGGTCGTFPIDIERETPGVVGEIVRWILETAQKPQPELALANALAFCGALMGRRVKSKTDLRTNLYCLGVGESACGKDHSRKAIKKLCDAAGLMSLLGGEEFASDGGIEASVFANPAILFQLDEIGHMLSVQNSKYAASCERAIVPKLMKFFSSASTVFLGKEYASGRPRTDISEPNLCLYGTTTPAKLYGSLQTGEISDGFLNRMIVFKSGDPDPMETGADFTDAPTSLVMECKQWRPGGQNPVGGKGLPGHPIWGTTTILPTPDATEVFRRFSVECRQARSETRDGSGLDSLWGRAGEHCQKVALILACGCGDPNKMSEIKIEESHASYATKLIRHLTIDFVERIRNDVTDTDFGRSVNVIRDIIAAAGKKGIAMNALTRKLQKMPARTRKEVIENLVGGGSVTLSVETPVGLGRPTTILRAT